MSWLSTLYNVVFYLYLPIAFISKLLSPFRHLGRLVMTPFLIPIRLLARFETILIYLGTAAIVGSLTGLGLYACSTVLIGLLGLNDHPAKASRTAASFRVAQERKKLESAWDSSYSRDEVRQKLSPDGEIRYAEWLEGDRDDQRGLMSSTILEEEDSDTY